ncbi:MAG: 6-phosphogluconolactonase [Armatimonadetes bacterium]|nr:6-phosphogluconolactonase [Armatimonadota bacterium]
MRIEIFPDLQALSRKAASYIVEEARASRDRPFTLALSGGSTPREAYRSLADPSFSSLMPWKRTHIFWVDERMVSPTDCDSNYGMVRNLLVSHISVPPENVHPFAGDLPSPEEAAARYEVELKEFFQLGRGQFPEFNLVLLGMGEDGHTASLFPSSKALLETRRLAVPAHSEKPPHSRLTLTLPVLNMAKKIIFLVTGKEKAYTVKRVLKDPREASPLPAGLIQPSLGRVLWLLDEEAASQLRPVRGI